MVTIDVSDDVWRYLQLGKNPGDSFNDVLERELDLNGERREIEPEVQTEPEESGSEREAEGLQDELEFPSGRDREACFDAIEAATDYVREHGSASMREIVTDVMPDHPLGYDVPELEEGDRYRGSWWRKIVKPGLEADGRLDAPSGGRREWRWVGQ